jgi:hypothetical protein
MLGRFLLSNLQAFNDATIEQVLLNDFLDILFVDVVIPNLFRVNNNHRPVIATIHATGLVDAHLALAFKFQLGNSIFRVGLRFGGAQAVATAFTLASLIAAEENMMFEVTHRKTPWLRGKAI